jgi:CubicO group peptidase (beta-lactamase class C family)
MTIIKTITKATLVLWLSFIFQEASLATDVIQDNDPGKRSNIYIDDTGELNQSGWKAMISNAFPHKVQASGRWFDPAPTSRPFGLSKDMKPFSVKMRVRLRDNSTDGLIVVKDYVIVRQYFRFGFDIDDIHQVHSVGKVFTSFAMQPIYDRIGRAGLDRRLDEYLPRLKGKFFGLSTLGQALDMQNGMEWTENYEDPTTATMISFSVSGLEPVDPKKGPESWYERMFDFPKYGEHGKTWVYSNSAVLAASFAAASIAEQPFSDLVQDSYNTLGFEDRSWYTVNELKELSAEGGQAMSIRDYAKLGRFMLHTKGSAYVDDVWNEIADPNDPADAKFLAKYGKMFGFDGYKNYWYSFGPNTIMGMGSSGIFLYVDRSKGLVIAKFSSFVQGQGAEEFGEAIAIVKEIAAGY